jgi:O-antigen/teichoic acid export membrane protein
MIGLNITKKTKSIATTTILVTILNLLLNILLVPWLGIMGAASSGLIAQFIFFIIIYIAAQKYYTIPYEMGKVTTMVVIASILYILSSFTEPLSVLWIRVFIKFILICSFPFILYIVGFYEAVEIASMRGFWNKWKNPMHWKENFSSLRMKD